MITLEKIDQVVERTGASYEEAKQALEIAEGNVIEAIIYLQNEKENAEERKGVKKSDILDTLKEFIRKGNVSRIIVTNKNETLLNIPVTFGAIGIIIAPVIAVLGVGTILVTDINISIQDHTGKIIDLNKETAERVDKLKEKGAKTKDTAERKAEDLKNKFSKKVDDIEDEFEEVVEDFRESYENIKDEAKDTAKNVKEEVEDGVENIKDEINDAEIFEVDKK